MRLPADLIDLLTAFDAAGAEYLLIGGYAVAIHGHPRSTKDADVWVRPDAANVVRVQEALREFGAPMAVVEGISAAQGLDVVWMGMPPHRIDLVKHVPGGDFDAAYGRRTQLATPAGHIQVVSRADLIALKRASGRPQDLVDADVLEAGARTV